MGVLYWTLRSLLSHWRRHPVQGVSLITGLWLATALFTGVLALNSQARQSYALASQMVGGEAQANIVARDGADFAQSTFIALRLQGWPVSPVLEGRVTLVSHPQLRLQVVGIEPLTLPVGSPVAGAVPNVDELSAFIGTPGRTWVAPQTLRELGAEEGTRLHTSTGQALPPLHTRAQMAPGVLLMDIGAAQAALQTPEQLSRLLLPKSFQQALPDAYTDRLQINRSDADGDLARLTDSFHLNLTALGLLAFVVGLFIVHAAIGLALEQRRALLRTLRACGVSAALLVLALVLELGLLALLGGLAGIASGYWLASLLLPDVAASLRGLYGAEVAGQLNLSPAWWLAGLALSLGGVLLAGADSLWRAARLPLLALSGGEAWHQAHRQWLRRQAMVAVAAALVALSCAVFGNGLASGFILMGSLLLAAALALPVLLSSALALLARCRWGVLGQWFLADCRQQLPGLSLALMALLLALAANIGAASMTEGFRQTFTGWLEQRLSAELYLRPQHPEQAPALQQWLQQRHEVQQVLPGWEMQIRQQGWPTELAAVIDAPLYRQHWPLLEQAAGNPWDTLFSSDSLMLSEQLARRLGVGIGALLALPAAQGQWNPTVVGIYADYGNPKGHILVSAVQFQQHWPGTSPARFALRMAEVDTASLKNEVQQAFGLDDSHVVEQRQLKRWASQVFERTFSATAALNALTLGVAGVALFIGLLTQSQSRLGQLAPLWAMGVGRRQLILLSVAQTLILAVLTLALAIPLGILLAWCLVAVINVQAFGWRLPLQVFPLQILQLCGLALIAAMLASAWPMLRLQRSQPTDLLRVMASER
ncbi:ABC transporter permease [Pseudomonas rhizosphaerae]|uniref:ABC transporter permease n=1 Tax=Pseudomonas rhizosphaerae TaxID=216142 RepID=UPI002B48829F|nr:FtsX-like permease family protein [Pseudomonas rhizosphaerae]MEB2871387.1 FtsX-like permease family protein [Pseudomonas rhizosphaerae]